MLQAGLYQLLLQFHGVLYAQLPLVLLYAFVLLVQLAATIGHYLDRVEDRNRLPGCRTVTFNTKFQI